MTMDVSLHLRPLLCLVLSALAVQPAVAAAAAPANDNFGDAQAVTLPDRTVSYLPSEVAGTNVDATLEADEPVPGGVDSGHSVWYRLTTDTATAVRIYVCSLGLPRGAGRVRRRQPRRADARSATAPDQACRHGGVIDLVTTPGTTYRIVVRGEGVEMGTFKLSVALAGPADRAPAADAGAGLPGAPNSPVGRRRLRAGRMPAAARCA